MNKTSWNELRIGDRFVFECDKDKFVPMVYEKTHDERFWNTETFEQIRFTLDYAYDTIYKL